VVDFGTDGALIVIEHPSYACSRNHRLTQRPQREGNARPVTKIQKRRVVKVKPCEAGLPAEPFLCPIRQRAEADFFLVEFRLYYKLALWLWLLAHYQQRGKRVPFH